ncbi:MAG: hypothetical protein KatS3mg029_0153 [Saprospiraceae bacterium]|nr:MAG: hypothetical protein KatS3mg029_0153 [Saprospiraceae bacterium]
MGIVVLALLGVGFGVLFAAVLPIIMKLMQNTLTLTLMLVGLAGLLYVIFDPRMRALIGYGFKALMRWITSLFVTVDPIAVLKSYVEELQQNLYNMRRQMNQLRGQMHQLKEIMVKNEREIQANLEAASQAKSMAQQKVVVLKSRKAGRLRESNMRLDELYKRMQVLYRILERMYEHSEILMEDIKDQVAIKEQERKAIHASTSAMRSAMRLLKGDKDKRATFEEALEAVADDVSQKMGEMERFMEATANFMDSIDLKNGVFEEEGLEMLEKWEKETFSKILGEEKQLLLDKNRTDDESLDLRQPVKQPQKQEHKNQYDSFFE